MELIAAVLFAGPLGYFSGTRTRGLVLYLLVWAVVFPIQTVVVHSGNPDDIGVSYFVVNAVFLALGVGLNTWGARLRERRTRPAGRSSWMMPQVEAVQEERDGRAVVFGRAAAGDVAAHDGSGHRGDRGR